PAPWRPLWVIALCPSNARSTRLPTIIGSTLYWKPTDGSATARYVDAIHSSGCQYPPPPLPAQRPELASSWATTLAPSRSRQRMYQLLVSEHGSVPAGGSP